jgi:prolipoprotein diacylglyceryltransferase
MHLTADKIEEMTKEEKRDEFMRLGALVYGTERFGTEFCRDTGAATSTVANWRGLIAEVPTMAILLLHAWALQRNSDVIMMEAIDETATSLAKVATTLRGAALHARKNLGRDGEAD